ncbi:MAG: hypothetical protein WCI02_02775 [Planctomycetota bacterium]
MNVQIDVGEIVIDGVSISEPQLFELRLALERQLTERFESLGTAGLSVVEHPRVVIQAGLGGSPVQLATQIATSIQGTATAPPSFSPSPRSGERGPVGEGHTQGQTRRDPS